MAKVRAALKDVSTDYTPVNPDLYTVQIAEVVEEVKDEGGLERVNYIIKATILSGDDTDDEFAGRILTDYIYIHKKDGTINEYGLVQLKRWVEALCGLDRAEDPDFDTDEMIGRECYAQTVIEEYETRKIDPSTSTRIMGRRNTIELVASL